MPISTDPTTRKPETDIPAPPGHVYHAAAHVLSGKLERPILQDIVDQAPLTLTDRRGGHLTRYVNEFSLEGLISYTKGETRVSGARSLKNEGWVTLATSILEGMNIFEIVTAEKIVSQVYTDHPPVNGHFPKVRFIGTQFKNLEVSGFPVELKLNLDICGDIPKGGRSYLQDPDFLGKVRDQTAAIADDSRLPATLKKVYDDKLTYIEELIRTCDGAYQGAHAPITCSIVESIGKIPIKGVEAIGNVLVIPGFGSVALGEVEVGEKVYDGNPRPCVYFTLRCLRAKLGCAGDGNTDAGTSTANGQTVP
jgi:hypothetical protein